MRLRTQLHDAIDEVTPPAPNLERRVSAFVLAGKRERKVLRLRPRSRWTSRFRGAGAFLAAAVVIALIVGLVLGGRFWRNLNAPPSAVDQTELKSLESIPLNLPAVSSADQCPQTPITLRPTGLMIGDGPFYRMTGNGPLGVTTWGNWAGDRFVYEAEVPGLVLIRAQDLVTGQRAVFAQFPYGPSGASAAGPVLGTDLVPGVGDATVHMRAEAVVQDQWHTSPVKNTNRLPPLDVMIGLPAGSSGCIGYQVDGPNFDSHFYVYAPTPWTR